MKEQMNEYEALKKKVLEQFKKGENLLGKKGAFQPLLKEFLESIFQIAQFNLHYHGYNQR